MGHSKGAPSRHLTAADAERLLARAFDDVRSGNSERAERDFRRILADRPSEYRAAELLSMMLVERNEADEAVEVLRAAASHVGSITRENATFFNNYANALRRAKQLDESETMLREIVRVAPEQWQAWHNLAQVLRDEHGVHEAIAAIRRATALEPGFGPNHAVLGEMLQKLGRYNSAKAAFVRCLELGWDGDVNVWTLLGNTCRQLGELDDAIAHLRRVAEVAPGSAHARSNLGLSLVQAGFLDEAVAEFEAALALDDDDVGIKANAGYGYLTVGQIDLGWEYWEWGIQGGPRGKGRMPEGVSLWTPEDPGTRLMVYREQGVGDEIMFASVYDDLLDVADDVIIETDKRLTSLFARSFPRALVRPFSFDLDRGCEGIDPPDFDRILPCGSLPPIFRRAHLSFPVERDPYLVPDPARVDAWRERLETAPGAVVGISWRSLVKTAERRLEYTQLREWQDIFAVPGVTWVNLQYDDCERELVEAEELFGVDILRWPWLDLTNDFEEVAALMSCLDFVVAPRNAVAMLAGALMIPTVMMGNAWDWSDLGTGHSPWFPTVTLAVREDRADWDEVLRQAAAHVAAAATTGQTQARKATD
jgi:tetratricopeptide (TPR) repeat protein